MRVMRSVRRQSARSRYKILAGRHHVTSTASHPSHVRCHCPATWRHNLTNYPWHVWGATIWTLCLISGDTQVVFCGRLAGVWLASVNEAVFGVIIFLLSSYYLIIILLSGVMASIHHTSSHCSHYSQGPPSSCRLMAQLTRMRSCAVKRTPGNLWSLWFHPSQEMWPDFIYSSGHEVAGSWKIVQATHSQTQLELQLRTETKKMECWPQSCAVAVVSSISGGARGWSPESRGWAVWCRGRWRWRTCSPGATLATLVLAPCHGYTLLPTALSCQHPGITLAMLILYYKRTEM